MSEDQNHERPLSKDELQAVTRRTIRHYDDNAASFWVGTKDHDVSQNVVALLTHIIGNPPFRILDFGCGPGRDLVQFKALEHEPVGLDGSAEFVALARQNSGCEVWLQDFLSLDLPASLFDGVFANASLFHVPRQELSGVMQALWDTLKPGGVLFCSNPRGNNQEGWSDTRYGCYHDLDQWRRYMIQAGFAELQHYYRPSGKPQSQQPWLATVWRKN